MGENRRVEGKGEPICREGGKKAVNSVTSQFAVMNAQEGQGLLEEGYIEKEYCAKNNVRKTTCEKQCAKNNVRNERMITYH